jgi:hypothetical protein
MNSFSKRNSKFEKNAKTLKTTQTKSVVNIIRKKKTGELACFFS